MSAPIVGLPVRTGTPFRCYNPIDFRPGQGAKAHNRHGVTLAGRVTGVPTEHGGPILVTLDLAGTTSTIQVDAADFKWQVDRSTAPTTPPTP